MIAVQCLLVDFTVLMLDFLPFTSLFLRGCQLLNYNGCNSYSFVEKANKFTEFNFFKVTQNGFQHIDFDGSL